MLWTMQTIPEREFVGYIDLQVGSLEVRVPVRNRPDTEQADPTAAFEAEGDSFAIVLTGDASSDEGQEAVRSAAQEAVRHLSKKLLN